MLSPLHFLYLLTHFLLLSRSYRKVIASFLKASFFSKATITALLLASAFTIIVFTFAAYTAVDSQLLFGCRFPSAVACCVGGPGGLFLRPQLGDPDPTTEPNDSWTIHGPWPDNCNGAYEESCDSSRKQSNLADILKHDGKSELVLHSELPAE
ncbi:hypothetical protein F5Y14DRAFT_430656 [Nemania sp. NC0429]|nr:hypothetical protein F5Y14DRAFT_430656 [Nemania sp. NC0429]